MSALSRRGFFGTLAAAAVGMALDPERLLWVPGQKTIFLPSLVRASGNTFLTPDIITREALAMFENASLRISINTRYVKEFYA